MGELLYSGTHEIPIYNQRNEECERRRVTINIIDYSEKLQIKLRDISEYSFNYSENMDLGDFEVIRVKQSLDINFSEFKDNLVEMFNQFSKKEMLLKCQLIDKKCTLIFYQTSKIKAIIYLTLDLHMTNQKVIILELVAEIHEVQESSKLLQKQQSKHKKTIREKELEIAELQHQKKKLSAAFLEYLQNIENVFEQKQNSTHTALTLAVQNVKIKLDKLEKTVSLLKKETTLKASCGDRLAQSLEKLQLENMDYAGKVQELKKQNCSLNITRCNLEKNVSDLRKSLEDAQIINHNLERRKGELEKDLEKISIAITQKDKQIEEMSKDLVQANTMLVNFNNHYDNKAQEAEELKNDCSVKEAQISEQKVQFKELLRAYQDYERKYNRENFDRLRQDLLSANKRNGELEEQMRKLNKMNALLSQKVGQGGLYNNLQ